MLRYHYIDKCECVNGEGWGVSLYVQGCPIHCPGCFQPETGDFNNGKEFEQEDEYNLYIALKNHYISRFSLLGGEPLAPQNIDDVLSILYFVRRKFPDIKIGVGTGYTYEELLERRSKYIETGGKEEYSPEYALKYIFKEIDYLIAGPFIQEEKDLTLKWRGSRNQEVIDMNLTRQTGYKVVIK